MKFSRVFLRIVFCLVLLVIAHKMFAQEQPTENLISERPERKVYHYIGLQGNQLIRQLLNFGGNSSAIANPYLLVYSVNSKKNGFGFSTGIGYSNIQTKTSDNFTNTTTSISDFALRLGLEKKTYLSKRWLVSVGGDIVIESNKSETLSKSGTVQNPSVTTTANRKGLGPRVSISYHIHDKILLGTEASYYFKWINQKQEITGSGAPPSGEPSADLRSFSFTLPAVIFIMVKL